jgi:predicted ATP-dependent endonuclease of OLD family
MITSLAIENFRGLQQVVLEELRRVNLIVGGNDTGKTSVLEALVLLFGDAAAIRSLPITFRTNQTGVQTADDQNDRETFWSWLFYDRDSKHRIALAAKIDSQATVRVKTEMLPEHKHARAPIEPVLIRIDSREINQIRAKAPIVPGGGVELLRIGENRLSIAGANSPPGFRMAVLSTRPTNPTADAENYNQVALLADGERRVEKVMKEIEPNLNRLRYAKLPRTTAPLIFADVGLSRSIPSSQMGQAFNRILHIYTQVLAHQTNILLIDEIENGIFSESMPVVWRGLLAMCEQEGVQIFATTHSRECVMAANSVAHERGSDELCVQRLQLVKRKVEAVRLGSQHLEMAAEMGLEVRS